MSNGQILFQIQVSGTPEMDKALATAGALKQKIDDLAAANRQLKAAAEGYAKAGDTAALQKTQQQMARNAAEIKGLRSEYNLQLNVIKSNTDSYAREEAQLKLLISQRKNMSVATEEERKEAASLDTQIGKLSSSLKAQQTAMKGHAEKTIDVGGAFKEVLGAAANFAGVGLGVGEITTAVLQFGQASIEAFNNSEKKAQQLAVAVGGNTQGFRDLSEKAKELEGKFGIDHADIESYQTYLATQGLTEDQINKTMEAAIHYSEVTGKDLKGSVEELSGSFQGNVDGIGKLDSRFKDFSAEQLKNGAAIDLINDKYKNFPPESLDLKIKRMGTSFTNFKEGVGKALVEAGSQLMGTFSDLGDSLTGFWKSLGLVGEKSDGTSLAMKVLKGVIQAIVVPVREVIQNLIILYDSYSAVINKVKDFSNDYLNTSFTVDKSANFQKVANDIKNMGNIWVDAYKSVTEEEKKNTEATVAYTNMADNQLKKLAEQGDRLAQSELDRRNNLHKRTLQMVEDELAKEQEKQKNLDENDKKGIAQSVANIKRLEEERDRITAQFENKRHQKAKQQTDDKLAQQQEYLNKLNELIERGEQDELNRESDTREGAMKAEQHAYDQQLAQYQLNEDGINKLKAKSTKDLTKTEQAQLDAYEALLTQHNNSVKDINSKFDKEDLKERDEAADAKILLAAKAHNEEIITANKNFAEEMSILQKQHLTRQISSEKFRKASERAEQEHQNALKNIQLKALQDQATAVQKFLDEQNSNDPKAPKLSPEEISKLQKQLDDLKNQISTLGKESSTENGKGGDNKKDWVKGWQQAASQVKELMDNLFAFVNQGYENQVKNLEKQKAKELSAHTLTAKQKEAIEAKYSKQEDAIQRKQFELNKKKQIADAIIATAQAVAQINANGAVNADPSQTLRAILTALVVANGAAQIAIIARQKYALGGVLRGPGHAQGGIPIRVGAGMVEAEGGEAIITREATRRYLPLLSAINQAGGGLPLSSRPHMAVGGLTAPYFPAPQNTGLDYDKLAKTISSNMVVVNNVQDTFNVAGNISRVRNTAGTR